MFVALLLVFTLRMLFWLCVVLVTIGLVLCGALVGLGGVLIGLRSPETGAQWRKAAGQISSAAMRAATVADNHRRWVLPNKKPVRPQEQESESAPGPTWSPPAFDPMHPDRITERAAAIREDREARDRLAARRKRQADEGGR